MAATSQPTSQPTSAPTSAPASARPQLSRRSFIGLTGSAGLASAAALKIGPEVIKTVIRLSSDIRP